MHALNEWTITAPGPGRALAGGITDTSLALYGQQVFYVYM